MRPAQPSFPIPILLAPLLLIAGCDYFVSPEARVERAQEQIRQGDHRRALLELKNAIEKRPDLQPARLLLADLALWLGDAAAADEELRRVSPQLDPAKFADVQARIDLAMGRPQKVLERLDAGSSAIEPAKQALYRGLALLSSNRAAAAAESFRAALQIDPKLVAAEVGIAESLAAQNDVPEALRVTTELVNRHPDAALAWFAHGALLARHREPEAAAEALQRASDLAPRQLDVPKRVALLSTLIDARLSAGEIEGARAASAILNRVVPGSPVAAVMSSRVDLASNDYPAAATQLRRVVNASPNLVQARFLLAVALMAQGNLEQASAELNRVVEQVPEHLEARQLLARARMRLQDPDGAMRALVPALQSGGDDAELTSLFDIARSQATGEQAVPLLQRALAADPGNSALEVQLASAYLHVGAFDKALMLLRRKPDEAADVRRFALLLEAVLRSEGQSSATVEAERMVAAHPADARIRSIAAAFYVRLGDAAKATTHLEAARQSSAAAIEPRLLLARLAIGRNDAKLADALVAEVLKAAPARAEVLSSIGMLYQSAGRYDRAVEHFRAGTAIDPASAPVWLNLGRAQAALGQSAPAREALNKALALRPNWVAAEGVLVFMDLQNGAREAAMQRIAALKTAAPQDPNVHALDGEVRLMVRQYAEAAAAFEAAYTLQPAAALAAKLYQTRAAGGMPAATQPLENWLRRHPDDLALRSLLAEAYVRAGERRKAAEQYETLLARQPSHVPALNNLAWLYYELKDPRALDLARRAAGAAPRSAAVNDTLGWILVEAGRLQEGLPILKAASEQPGSTADIHYHYAAGLARAGSIAEARARLQRLLKEEAAFSTRAAAEQLLDQLAQASGPGSEE